MSQSEIFTFDGTDFSSAGTLNLTSGDAAIGPVGKPVRLFSVTLVAGGGGASVLILYNGTSTGGTPFIQVDSAASKSTTHDFTNGILFPAGCFAHSDANLAYATFEAGSEK